MPFTFSHPAIILPILEHRKISATALVVGSMSPDFEYFFRMKMQSEISHSFLGILLIDFPLGLLVMCVFHGIITNSLIDHLPSFFKARLQLLKNNNWFTYLKNNVLVVGNTAPPGRADWTDLRRKASVFECVNPRGKRCHIAQAWGAGVRARPPAA